MNTPDITPSSSVPAGVGVLPESPGFGPGNAARPGFDQAFGEAIDPAFWPESGDEAGENTLYAVVNRVVYSNPENGYAVLSVSDADGRTQTLVGTFPYAWPGENITAYGRWAVHASYGRQFTAESSDRSAPVGEKEIYSYLAAGTVRGIREATASQLVSRFGAKALQVLERQPEKLAAIPGIGLRRAEELSREYRKQQNLKDLIVLLSSGGVSAEYAVRAWRSFGGQTARRVRENPYLLTSPSVGAPFSAADRLAFDLGISENDPNRIRAGLRFVLEHNERNGHCFIPCGKLLAAAARQLSLDEAEVAGHLDALLEAGELVRETVAGQDACYLPDLYLAECETARRIARMARAEAAPVPSPDPEAERMIRSCEAGLGIVLAPLQREILNLALHCCIVAVTGGPGTGKTTSLRALVRLYERMGLKTLLAAPTGRAAKRMEEAAGVEAATLHRLLGAGRSEEGGATVFSYNRDNRLRCDALIVDECSMLDIRLMHALLEALPERARLILVGDASQLPSVGPGDVFSAILRSGVVPSVRLEEIFRQQGDSRIVRNAHLIDEGKHPDFSENTGDFFRLKRLQAATQAETVVELCSLRLPQKMHIPPEEIQVLSPTRKGECGTVNLNRLLQAALNPPSPEKKERPFGNAVFREGDRVIQTRNNYDIPWRKAGGEEGTGILNGDIGVLREIRPEDQSVLVDFDGRLALYDFEALEDLEHSWALTVHKSQGCEYRAVVLALSDASRKLLTRMVLYTAVSRARELLILVGSDQTAFQMIDNNAATRRYNALRVRILAAFQADEADMDGGAEVTLAASAGSGV